MRARKRAPRTRKTKHGVSVEQARGNLTPRQKERRNDVLLWLLKAGKISQDEAAVGSLFVVRHLHKEQTAGMATSNIQRSGAGRAQAATDHLLWHIDAVRGFDKAMQEVKALGDKTPLGGQVYMNVFHWALIDRIGLERIDAAFQKRRHWSRNIVMDCLHHLANIVARSKHKIPKPLKY